MVKGFLILLGGAGGADKNSGILFGKFFPNGLRCFIASARMGGVAIV